MKLEGAQEKEIGAEAEEALRAGVAARAALEAELQRLQRHRSICESLTPTSRLRTDEPSNRVTTTKPNNQVKNADVKLAESDSYM